MSKQGTAIGDASAIIFENVNVFDGVSAHLLEGFHVAVEGTAIKEVSEKPVTLTNAYRIDGAGKTLMPGLIDAHVHVMGSSANVTSLQSSPPTYDAYHATRMLRHAIDCGFTTMRDVAGCDAGTARAIEEGLIAGPRLYYAGKALSMTGGHGDLRSADHGPQLCNCHLMNKLCHIVDGADAVRWAAREELRRGAHCLKLMVSGGVLSPTDPIWMDQFCNDEVAAAVEEAVRWRSYVAAHCHTASAMRRCVDLGVRSIEHATLMDHETADAIKNAGAFVVPTLAMAMALTEEENLLGLPSAVQAKAQELVTHYLSSLEIMDRKGLKMAFGTDLLGGLYSLQCREFLYRCEVQTPISVLQSATSVGADLLMRPDLGRVEAGARADLLLVNGDPLEDISLLASDGGHLHAIMKDGCFHKVPEFGRA